MAQRAHLAYQASQIITMLTDLLNKSNVGLGQQYPHAPHPMYGLIRGPRGPSPSGTVLARSPGEPSPRSSPRSPGRPDGNRVETMAVEQPATNRVPSPHPPSRRPSP